MNQHKRFSQYRYGSRDGECRNRKQDKRQSHGRARAWLKRELLKLR